MYNGIINIYKEAGFTSHDVVARMRGILKQKKIGHTGTLDPEAVGVLPVCLGSATRLCDMLTGQDKEYEAVMLLGVETDTQDLTGRILADKPVGCPPDEARRAVLSFVGEYDQVPPMYSACKVGGRKLYELAREGKEVERSPRRVLISSIEITDLNLPRISLRVTCSKGTYIRTLCHDIGQKLGCGAAMESLKRTRAGRFGIAEAISLAQLEQLCREGREQERILPVETVFAHLPAIHVRKAYEGLIRNGNAFYGSQAVEEQLCREQIQARIYDEDGTFYGIYGYDPEGRRMKPVKMFFER